jgi:uncharacterized OB-fold protein
MSQKAEFEAFLKKMEDMVAFAKAQFGFPILIDPRIGIVMWYDQRELKVKFIISVDKVRKFFEALREGKLLATKCKSTGRILFPPQVDCPDDPKSEVEWIELPTEGELITWTIINVKPYSFSHYPDYIVGIARLPAVNINVLAWVKCKDPSKLKQGMKVKITIEKREPEGYLTYQIVPVEEC